MRQNLPVSQKEYALKDDSTLMSITDTQSHIQYCNASFIEVSGFELDELMQQPHNLVRHPDMPPAAFEDMWRTLKGGDSWTGLVKNRRKNGDHYWVRANATPVQREDKVVGYLSVRTKPSADEVAKTAQLYAHFRQGRMKGKRLFKGITIRSGLFAWTSLLQVIPVRWRLALGLSAQVAGTLLAGWLLGVNGSMLENLVLCQLAVTLAVGFFINRQISQPLTAVLEQAKMVAAGQLANDKPLNRVDEIGMLQRAINQSGLNLRSLIDDVSEQVTGVTNSSRELSEGNIDLSQRTETTSESLQRTAAAVLQTSQSLEQNAGTAQEVSSLSAEASNVAQEGWNVVTEVITTMSAIQTSSEKISSIIGLIDDIAFQTNILALNAAVEAARAGEQGRSFAVVAGEVRTLAERSTEAARDIKVLINDSAERIEQGTKLANHAGESMENIRSQFDQVSDLIAGISAAVIQQSLAVNQVSSSINDLDDMTTRNAGLVAESSEASSDLLARAGRLAEAVGVYSTSDRSASEQSAVNADSLESINFQSL